MELKKNPKLNIYLKRGLTFNFSMVISLTIIITGFEWKFYYDRNLVNLYEIEDDFEEIIEVPPTHQSPPPPPKIVQPEIIEIPDDEEIIEELEVIIDMEREIEEEVIEQQVIEQAPEEEETDEIFLFVESPPEFKGGQVAFLQFIQASIIYPEKAKRMGIEGKVFVKIVIEKDGSTSSAEVVRGIGGGCNEEALRVLNNCPKWIPGKQRGRPVRVSVTLAIKFELQG